MSDNRSNVVSVSGTDFEITALSARQVVAVANLLGDLMLKGNKKLKQLSMDDSNALIWSILSVMDEDSIIKLAVILTNCDEQFAKDNFNLVWVIQALKIQLESEDLRAVLENFTTLFSQVTQEEE